MPSIHSCATNSDKPSFIETMLILFTRICFVHIIVLRIRFRIIQVSGSGFRLQIHMSKLRAFIIFLFAESLLYIIFGIYDLQVVSFKKSNVFLEIRPPPSSSALYFFSIRVKVWIRIPKTIKQFDYILQFIIKPIIFTGIYFANNCVADPVPDHAGIRIRIKIRADPY